MERQLRPASFYDLTLQHNMDEIGLDIVQNTLVVRNHQHTQVRRQRHFDQRHRDAAVRNIVAGSDRAIGDPPADKLPAAALGGGLHRRPRRIVGDTVVIDNERGARDATEHLLGLGHRRIGFVQGRRHLSTSRERLEGYRHALRDAGVPFDPALVGEGDSRQVSGERCTRELLAVRPPPTALLVSNNMMTLGALVAIVGSMDIVFGEIDR